MNNKILENNKISNIKNYYSDITIINDDIINLTSLIDKQILEIYDENELSNKKILQYKLLLENIILEYHKICKEIYKNN